MIGKSNRGLALATAAGVVVALCDFFQLGGGI
jgi:hypothetical protein